MKSTIYILLNISGFLFEHYETFFFFITMTLMVDLIFSFIAIALLRMGIITK